MNLNYQNPINQFEVSANVRLDYIYACIYIPHQQHSDGILSEYFGPFRGSISLDISYVAPGREYQILGYQMAENGQKILIAALHGLAVTLSSTNTLNLISVS